MNENLYLITDTANYQSGHIIYRGGKAEKLWWDECDKRGISFVMAYRSGKYYAVTWDFITLGVQGYELHKPESFYEEIRDIYSRFWKLKKSPFHYGSTGRIKRLSRDEAIQCASDVSAILEKYKVKRGTHEAH